MTDSNPGLDAARDLALQKIGRAVFNYQKIERMLKWLMAVSNISVPLSKFTEEFEARKKRVERQSLGNVAKEAAAHLRNPPEHPTNAISEPWITFRLEGPDGNAVEWDFERALQSIVDDRNHLVHQRLGVHEPGIRATVVRTQRRSGCHGGKVFAAGAAP
jgi:hypothetical protein